jgi:hypothetical protein
MTRRAASDRAGLLTIVMVAGLAACAVGLVVAVATDSPVAAQRGGAVAVALTFAMLFLGRDTAERTIEAELPAGLPGIDAEARPVRPETAALAAEAALGRVRDALAAAPDPIPSGGDLDGPMRALRTAERLADLVDPAIGAPPAARTDIAAAKAVLTGRLGPQGTALQEQRLMILEVRDQADVTRSALAALLDWQAQEKWRLALPSVAGTLMAGFGDAIARFFGAGP